MLMRILLGLVLVLFALASTAQDGGRDERAVKERMNEQLREWNKGDINAFMQTYWQNDSLLFVGKSGVSWGWTKALENYKRNYPDTAAMGKLQFELLQVKRLSPIYFFVVGKWHLTRSIGDLKGAFTLIFRKEKDEWVIVADHSS